MTTRSRSILLTLLSLTFTAALDAQVLRIAAHDRSRSGDVNLADGRNLGDLRDALSAHIEDLGFESYEIVSMRTLTNEALAEVQLAIVHNTFDNSGPMSPGLSPSEQDALLAFVAGGGSLFVFVDNYKGNSQAVQSADSILAPFGLSLGNASLHCEAFVQLTEPRLHPVTGGRFGAAPYLGFGTTGWFGGVGELTYPVVSVMRSEALPILAAMDSGALGAGSGRAVFTADANWIGDQEVHVSFRFREHAVLFLNSMSWLTVPCDAAAIPVRSLTPPAPGIGWDVRAGDRVTVSLSFGNVRTGEAACGLPGVVSLRESLPEGWIVDEQSVTDGGIYEAAENTISWTFAAGGLSEETMISYDVVLPEEPEEAMFRGSIVEEGETTRAVVHGDDTLRPYQENALRIATLDGTRHGQYGFSDGRWLRLVREDLSSRVADFGFDRLEITPLKELSDEGLAEAHLVVLVDRRFQNCAIELAPEETNSLESFVLGGGSALLVLDGAIDRSGGQSYLSPFGLRLAGSHIAEWGRSSSVPNPDGHPLTSGPYATIRSVTTGSPGWFSTVGSFATSVVNLGANGQPLVAAIERNALAAGSGRVVLTSDSNWLFDPTPPPLDFFYPQNRNFALNTFAWLTDSGPVLPEFRRGDCNDDGAVDISDAIFSLGYLFLGQGDPSCDDACDSNDDGMLDISDATTTLGVLFLGDGSIPAPGATECGDDPTADDALGCEAFERCP